MDIQLNAASAELQKCSCGNYKLADQYQALSTKNIDHGVLEPTISLKEIPSEPTDALK